MAETIIIAELDINVEGLLADAQNTKKVLNQLKKANKELKDANKETTKEFVKNEVAIKRLSTKYNEQKNVLVALNARNAEFISLEKSLTIEINRNVVSITEARKNNKALLKIRNELNLQTKAGRQALTQVNKKLDENNKFIKDNSDALSKQKINIGNYQSALGGLNPTLSRNIGLLVQAKAALTSQAAAMRATSTATTKGAKALNVFKIALISTGIGAIVVALGALIAAFSSTQQGVDAINRALAPLKGAFQGIIGVIQDISLNVFGQLGDRFTVVSGLILQGIDLIRLGWNKLSGDIEESIEIQERMIKRSEEMADAQVRLNEKSAALGDIFKGAGEQIAAAAKAQQQIVELGIQIETQEANLILTREIAAEQIKRQQILANDRTLSAQENNAAAEEGIRVGRELAAQVKDLINLEITREELRQSQNDSGRADLKALNEIKVKGIEADKQAAATELKFLTARAVLVKEQRAATKKAQEETKKEREKELEATKDFEQQKIDLQNEIDLANAESDKEKEVLAAEQQLEKDLLELEEIQMTEDRKNELKELIETNHKIALQEITDKFDEEAETKEKLAQENAIKERQKANVAENRAAVQQERAKARIVQAGINILKGLLGESLFARISAIAIQALTDIALVKISTASAQQRNIAQATATVPPPFNVPFIATAAAQNIGLGIKSKLAQGRILQAAAISAVSSAFYEGGRVPTGTGGRISGSNIPTQRGGDNILATVKSGEVILNNDQQARAGGSAFFKSIGVPGFQGGGVTGINTNAPAIASAQQLNFESLGEVIAENINDIKIVAIVDEISEEQAIQAEIVDGANI